MRGVYHFAATVLLGYDTAPTSSFGTSNEGGTKHIVEHPGRQGFVGYVGAVWMVGGVDYEDMKWYNYVVNPFVAVNPTAPTKDVVFGTTITPTGGISLAVGASLHERTVLDGYSVNDPFTGDGTVPTRSTWSGVKPGFMIGVALDSNIYAAVKSLGSK